MSQKQFQITKPAVDIQLQAIECKDLEPEKMDPIGYFLVRIHKDKIEVGLCNYKEINQIKKLWVGNKPQNIYRQIVKDLPRLQRDHCAYLGKELARAWICMKMETKYVQDGKVDGSFPEIEVFHK
jgi:tetrahydromethanopterin S-methyltransferase subunit A